MPPVPRDAGGIVMREHRTIGHPVGIRSRPPRHRARCLARPTTPHPFWRGAIGSRSLSVKAPRGPHARGVPRRERLTLLPRVVSRRGFSARRLEDTSFGMEHTSQVGPSVAERHRVRALHHARRAPRLRCAPMAAGALTSTELPLGPTHTQGQLRAMRHHGASVNSRDPKLRTGSAPTRWPTDCPPRRA